MFELPNLKRYIIGVINNSNYFNVYRTQYFESDYMEDITSHFKTKFVIRKKSKAKIYPKQYSIRIIDCQYKETNSFTNHSNIPLL